MANQSRQRTIPDFLYFVTLGAAACFLTLLDIAHFTLYLTYWIPAIAVTIIPMWLCLEKPSRIRRVWLSLLLIWIFILPYIRWDRTKSFFIDAHRLHIGMTTVQARTIMEPYLEFEEPDGIRFKPKEGGGDMCLIYLEHDKVVQIEIGVD